MRVIPVALLLAAGFFLSACDRQAERLRIARPALPVNQAIAKNLTTMIGERSGLQLEISAQSMTDEQAMNALLAGEAEIALVSNMTPFRDGIATVIPLYPTVLHVAYTEDRDASSAEALISGARVFAGIDGSTSRAMFERFVERLDIDETSFDYVSDTTTLADVVVLFTPIAPADVASYPQFRLFSFGPIDDIGRGSRIDAATLLNPQLRPFVIPAGTYGAVTPEPVLTLAVDQMLVAREDLDTSIVYDLVVALLRSRPALTARHPGLFEHLNDDFDVSRSTFVIHPGTQAYLQREAPTIYERYSGVAEVAVTLLLAVVSAAIAGLRILQRRRKNRIDRYYSEVIRIRDTLAADATTNDRRRAVGEIRSLQDNAFDQLVDEKLAADESFLIFITLSNDVLRQLGTNDIDSPAIGD